MGRLSRCPITNSERTGVAGQYSLSRDQPAYCDQATDHQQRSCDIVRDYPSLTVCRGGRPNSALSDALS